MPDRLKSTGKRNPLPYGRSHYGPGEEFLASSVDARVLMTVGFATRVEQVETTPALLAPPITKVLEASDAPTFTSDVVIEDPPKRKRGRPRKGEYSRRDMRAKE